jgi:hypothetical protein
MPMSRTSFAPQPRSLSRAALVLGLVLLLHAVALVGVRRELALATPAKPTQTTLSVALLRPPPPPAAAPATSPAPAPSPSPRTRAPERAISVAPAEPAAPAPAPAPPPPAPEPAPPPVASAPPPETLGRTLPPGVEQLPTQGRIAYRTTYTRMRGITALTYVDWSIDAEKGRYELWLRTVDPPGLLDLRSSGELKPFGIAPGRYVEKIEIANRELSVDFDWASRRVAFAGRGAGPELPFDDGTQDPLSLQFHLPLLAQAYPWRFTPGAVITFQVARRKVESYSFAVDRFEPMTINGREVYTLKIIRPKGPDSSRGVEFWLAPDFDWIPVRLRFIDTNDEVWDSVLAHLPGAEPPPAAPIQQDAVKP